MFVCPSARALKGIRVLELSTLRSVEVFSYAWRLNSASPVNVARILVRPRCLETLQRRNSDEYDCIGNCKIQHHKYFFLNRSILYSENKALRFWKTECKCRITLVDIFCTVVQNYQLIYIHTTQTYYKSVTLVAVCTNVS